MKYMIMLHGSQQDYDVLAGKDVAGKPAWSADDVAAMHAFMGSINDELVESGEFVTGHGLAAPMHTRRVQLRDGAPVVTDGPYAETHEVLAGYWIVECASFDRATEIAAKVSACPNPGDASDEYIDVRLLDEGVEDLEA